VKIPSNFDLRSLQVFVVTADQGGMTQSALGTPKRHLEKLKLLSSAN